LLLGTAVPSWLLPGTAVPSWLLLGTAVPSVMNAKQIHISGMHNPRMCYIRPLDQVKKHKKLLNDGDFMN